MAHRYAEGLAEADRLITLAIAGTVLMGLAVVVCVAMVIASVAG